MEPGFPAWCLCQPHRMAEQHPGSELIITPYPPAGSGRAPSTALPLKHSCPHPFMQTSSLAAREEGSTEGGSDSPCPNGKLPEHHHRGHLSHLDLFHPSFRVPHGDPTAHTHIHSAICSHTHPPPCPRSASAPRCHCCHSRGWRWGTA